MIDYGNCLCFANGFREKSSADAGRCIETLLTESGDGKHYIGDVVIGTTGF